MNLGSLLDYTEGLKGVYIDTAKEVGFTPGPEHFGYLLRVFCADTDEKAQRNRRDVPLDGASPQPRPGGTQ